MRFLHTVMNMWPQPNVSQINHRCWSTSSNIDCIAGLAIYLFILNS
jgi:hypothetical protein